MFGPASRTLLRVHRVHPGWRLLRHPGDDADPAAVVELGLCTTQAG